MEADLSLQMRFSLLSDESRRHSPIYKLEDALDDAFLIRNPKRFSIPRKAIGGSSYERVERQSSIPLNTTNESYEETRARYHTTPEDSPQNSFEGERRQPQRSASFETGEDSQEEERLQSQQEPQHANSFSSSRSDQSVFDIDQENQGNNNKIMRGWRFYGTFACLALVTLVCAIDATILSVALPVSLLCFHDRPIVSNIHFSTR